MRPIFPASYSTLSLDVHFGRMTQEAADSADADVDGAVFDFCRLIAIFIPAMKKLFSFFLIILYTTASSGATLHFHVCMGKLRSIGLADGRGSGDCALCGMEKKNGCCADIQKTFKTARDHSAAALHYNIQAKVPAPIIPSGYDLAAGVFAVADRAPLSATGPPGLASRPLFLRYCNFRI